MSLERDLNNYLRKQDELEEQAEQAIIKLREELLEECEWFFDEVKGMYKDRYPMLHPRQVDEILKEVVKYIL